MSSVQVLNTQYIQLHDYYGPWSLILTQFLPRPAPGKRCWQSILLQDYTLFIIIWIYYHAGGMLLAQNFVMGTCSSSELSYPWIHSFKFPIISSHWHHIRHRIYWSEFHHINHPMPMQPIELIYGSTVQVQPTWRCYWNCIIIWGH